MVRHLFVFLAISLTAGCITQSNVGNQSGTTNSVVDAETIRRDYQKSKDDAIKKYNGKEMTIKGKVYSISTFEGSSAAGTMVVNIADNFDGEMEHSVYLICDVAKGDYDGFKQVKEKDEITIKGFLFVDDRMIEVKTCKNMK